MTIFSHGDRCPKITFTSSAVLGASHTEIQAISVTFWGVGQVVLVAAGPISGEMAIWEGGNGWNNGRQDNKPVV